MATQSGLAFSLYESNPKIGHEEFVAAFLEQFPSCSPKNAALYWQNKARRAKFGLAPVQLPAQYKDGDKAPKAAVVRTAKRMAKEVAGEVLLPRAFYKASRKPEVKSDAEVSKIKAANLARMKEVSAKSKYNQVARPEGKGVKNFDSKKAREEVDNLLTDDSFKAPKFLSKDQVKALV
jgi:hypothetical protein